MEAVGEMVTPGEVVGRTWDVKAGRGTYSALHNNTVYASLTGLRHTIPPPSDSPDQVRKLLRTPTPRVFFLHFLDYCYHSHFHQIITESVVICL